MKVLVRFVCVISTHFLVTKQLQAYKRWKVLSDLTENVSYSEEFALALRVTVTTVNFHHGSKNRSVKSVILV